MREKKVSILIPCRNEENYISALIDSIIENDYNKEHLEILILDGMSSDKTQSIIDNHASKYNFIKKIENKYKTVPYAMNIGIQEAVGDIIIRMDAHAIYPTNYISQLVYYSEKLNATNVGAAWKTLPANDTLEAKAIALALSHPFGVGDAEYRTNTSNKEYIKTDTVPFGCYKKSIFSEIGLYDTDLTRNQDNELNERIIKNGGEIYLIPSLKIKYFARENLRKLGKMFFQYGYFGPLVDLKIGKKTRLRRYIPSIFLLSLLLPMIISVFYHPAIYISIAFFLLHLTANTIVSTKIAFKQGIGLFPYLMSAFLTSHLSYGFGYLKGFIDFKLLKKHKKEKIAISLSR